MMMKRATCPSLRCGSALLAAVMVIACAGCGRRVLEVGFVADLSGRGSHVGVSARNGANLAVREAERQAGGGQAVIRLTVVDDQGTPEGAVEADRALAARHVALVVGHATSGPGQAGIPVLQAAGIPVLSPLMSAASLTGRRDGFYRIIDENTVQGKVLAKAARDTSVRLGRPLRAAVLTESVNAAYTADVKDGFIEAWEEAGGDVVFEADYRAEGEIPFDRLAESIAGSGADTVLLVTGGMDLGLLVQKVHLLTPEARFYAGMWGMTADFVAHAGAAGEGTVFPSVFDPDSTEARWIAFQRAYLDAYGEEPDFAAVYGYEAMQVAIGALRAAGSADAASIGDALVAGAPWPGLQSDIPLDANGDSSRGYRLMVLESGRFTPWVSHE